MLICLYTVQAVVLITSASVRYLSQREVGIYSLQTTRMPRTYIYKALLHYAAGLCLFIALISYIFPNKGFTLDDNVRMFVTGAQGVCWLFSGLIMRFEYRRAIGHTLYMHSCFFGVSACIYLADLLY